MNEKPFEKNEHPKKKFPYPIEPERVERFKQIAGLDKATEEMFQKGYCAISLPKMVKAGFMYNMRTIREEDSDFSQFEKLAQMYNQWAKLELMEEDEDKIDDCRDFLEKHNITTDLSDIHVSKTLFDILVSLPESYYKKVHLSKILLHPPSYKSSYLEGYYKKDTGELGIDAKHLDNDKRTFILLFLHEMGHPFEEYLLNSDEDHVIEQIFNDIWDNDAFIGTAFGSADQQERIDYQAVKINEFLAETFMHYISQGTRLREYIDELNKKKNPAAASWERLYKIYNDALQVEFD